MAGKDPRRVVTPIARLSFPKLFKAESFKGQPAKFSATFIFDYDGSKLNNGELKTRKDGTVIMPAHQELLDAVHAAKVKQWGEDETKWPKKIVSPFHFGNEDKPDVDGYQDKYYITANNKHRPEVVMKGTLEPITEESGDLEAGHYVRGALRAFAYTEPKCGVTFSLESVMKVKDGPTFSGKEKAEVAFADVSDDEGDAKDADGGF
jgi:hypothetical protein